MRVFVPSENKNGTQSQSILIDAMNEWTVGRQRENAKPENERNWKLVQRIRFGHISFNWHHIAHTHTKLTLCYARAPAAGEKETEE